MKRSESIEDYLRAIYDLERLADGTVATSALADRLGVAPASVTGMLKRLDAAGLVVHERYAGVSLTVSGRKIALEVMRHHRLLETYLAEAMGMAWDSVHDEADRLEHHISEALEDRIAEILGHPERDPHGAAIPPKDGDFEESRFRTLDQAVPGERLVVREVQDEDADLLRHLGTMDLRPGAVLVVEEVAPFGGPITVRVITGGGGSASRAVGRRVAGSVSVEASSDQ